MADPGITQVHFYDPTWAEVTTDVPVYAFTWNTHRFQNRVGNWELTIPIDNGLIGGAPVHRQVRRGWHISLHELTDNDYWPLYLGVVQTRDYVTEGGGTILKLTGGLRGLHLTDRSTLKGLAYTAQAADQIIDDLVDGDNIIGAGPGGTNAWSGASITVSFDEPQTRLEAIIKVAGYARRTYNDSLNNDQPYIKSIDDPPDSGYVLQKVASFQDAIDIGPEDGIAIIADPPSVRFEGSNIVNRIIAIGSDTPDGDLTLGDATTSSPYVVQSATGPDANPYYYIEDADSIARYGLVETALVRTDVKNPSDDAGTRAAAANVLYAVAAGELLKRKSEVMVVDIPVANGGDVWAETGDKIRLTYTGQVQTFDGAVVWMDEDRFFMVSERHEESDPSGIRRVHFVLQAPEVEMHIPDLPDAIILPPQTTDPNPWDPGGGGGGGGDPGDFPQSSDCCDDPGTTTPGNDPPDGPGGPGYEPVPPITSTSPTDDVMLVALGTNYYRLTSTEGAWADLGGSGVTGSPFDLRFNLVAVGGHLFYITDNLNLKHSSDNGSSWSTIDFTGDVCGMGADGNNIAIAELSGSNPYNLLIKTSSNYGSSWSTAFTITNVGFLTAAVAVKGSDVAVAVVQNVTPYKFTMFLNGSGTQLVADDETPTTFNNGAIAAFDASGRPHVLWQHEYNDGPDDGYLFLDGEVMNGGPYPDAADINELSNRALIRADENLVLIVSDGARVSSDDGESTGAVSLPGGLCIGAAYESTADKIYLLFDDGACYAVTNPHSAHQTLSLPIQPEVGDTITIDGKTFTFLADGTSNSDGEIDVGSSLGDAQTNIVAAISGTDGWNTPHDSVKAYADTLAVVVRARAIGTAGNGLAVSASFNTVGDAWLGATLTGGVAWASTALPSLGGIVNPSLTDTSNLVLAALPV